MPLDQFFLKADIFLDVSITESIIPDKYRIQSSKAQAGTGLKQRVGM